MIHSPFMVPVISLLPVCLYLIRNRVIIPLKQLLQHLFFKNILWYILFIIFGSLILQILFARLIHLDGDTTLVTSVTLINSPPFVPLVAALLGNRELIVTGITIGLIGYLVGNYLGLGLFFLLAP